MLSGLRLSTLANAAQTVLRIGATGMDEQDKTPLLQHVALQLYRDLFLALRAEYRPELSSVTFYGTDSLSHKYWKYFKPSDFPDTDPAEVAAYGSVLPDYYEAADRALGEILESVDDKTTVLVVSDHGSQAIDGAQELRFPRLKGDELAKFLGVADRVDVTGIGNELIFTPKAGAAADMAALQQVRDHFAGARVEGFEEEPFVVDLIDREGESGDYVGVAFNLAVHLTGEDAFEKTLRFPDGRAVNLADYVAKDVPDLGRPPRARHRDREGTGRDARLAFRRRLAARRRADRTLAARPAGGRRHGRQGSRAGVRPGLGRDAADREDRVLRRIRRRSGRQRGRDDPRAARAPEGARIPLGVDGANPRQTRDDSRCSSCCSHSWWADSPPSCRRSCSSE